MGAIFTDKDLVLGAWNVGLEFAKVAMMTNIGPVIYFVHIFKEEDFLFDVENFLFWGLESDYILGPDHVEPGTTASDIGSDPFVWTDLVKHLVLWLLVKHEFRMDWLLWRSLLLLLLALLFWWSVFLLTLLTFLLGIKRSFLFIGLLSLFYQRFLNMSFRPVLVRLLLLRLLLRLPLLFLLVTLLFWRGRLGKDQLQELLLRLKFSLRILLLLLLWKTLFIWVLRLLLWAFFIRWRLIQKLQW